MEGEAIESFERVERITEVILIGENGGVRRIIFEEENERKIIPQQHWGRKNRSYETESKVFSGNRKDDIKDGSRTISVGNTEWEGFGTALKPAVENWILADTSRETPHFSKVG
jgi:hypothetical protein